jgi:hypothetical protein
MLEIVKTKGHGTLEGFSDIFKAERHFSVCKSTPWTNKCCLMLILDFDLNLIIPLKSVHKIKYFTSCTLVKNLVNERSREVLYLSLNNRGLPRINSSKMFSNMSSIWIGLNLMFENVGVDP